GGSSGGAGGQGGTSIPLTTANYDPAGRAAAAAVVDSAAAAGAVDTAFDADSSVRLPRDMTGLAKFAVDVALNAVSREQPQASRSGNGACAYGGSLSYTLNDSGVQDELDAGDVLSITASNCVLASGGAPVNGSFVMTFNSVAADGSAANVSLALTNFSSQGTSLTGNLTVAFNPSGGSVAFSNLRSTRAGIVNTYNYTATIVSSGGVDTLSYAGPITLGFNNGIYTVSTPVPLVAGLNHPTSGTLRLTDAAGGYIHLLAGATSFTIELYLPGDTTRDASATHTWADLASGKI
ncbi:MAG: hypothetical protein ABW051_01325, partial [Burkholderiaceae bacterium]